MVAVRFLPEAFLRPSHSLITGICPGINGNAAKGGKPDPLQRPEKNRVTSQCFVEKLSSIVEKRP